MESIGIFRRNQEIKKKEEEKNDRKSKGDATLADFDQVILQLHQKTISGPN